MTASRLTRRARSDAARAARAFLPPSRRAVEALMAVALGAAVSQRAAASAFMGRNHAEGARRSEKERDTVRVCVWRRGNNTLTRFNN